MVILRFRAGSVALFSGGITGSDRSQVYLLRTLQLFYSFRPKCYFEVHCLNFVHSTFTSQK